MPQRQAMRSLWSDPEWAAAQRARIRAGMAAREAGAQQATNGRISREAIKRCPMPKADAHGKIMFHSKLDQETFKALRAHALRSGKSISELVCTYVQWGLEAEGADPE